MIDEKAIPETEARLEAAEAELQRLFHEQQTLGREFALRLHELELETEQLGKRITHLKRLEAIAGVRRHLTPSGERNPRAETREVPAKK